MAKVSEMLGTLKAAADKRLSVAEEVQVAAKEEVQLVADASMGLAAEMKEASDAAYDEGLKKGLEQSGVPDETKVFSLEELNAEIALATEPLSAQLADKNVQLESLTSDVAALKAELDELKAVPPVTIPEDVTPFAQADVDAAVEAAVAKVKAEAGLSAEQEAALSDEMAALAAKLKPVAPAPVEPAPEV